MEDQYFVPTRFCTKPQSHTVVVHESYKAKKRKEEDEELKVRTEEVDMKQARFEIYKFAQTGLSNADRQKSQFELALRLGAVPEKNKPMNYVKLKEERKKLIEEAKEKAIMCEMGRKFRPPAFSTKMKDPKAVLKKKRKIGTGILKVYGKINKKSKT